MSDLRLITDRDAEAIVHGRSPHEDFDALVEVVGAVRHVAEGVPVAPSATLLALLAEGRSAVSTESHALPPAPLPMERRRKMPIPQFVAGLTIAGKVALGAGVAVAVTGTAAAAGALPDPVQSAVASAVETVTPFELPEGGTTDPTTPPDTSVPDTTMPTDTTTAPPETTVPDTTTPDTSTPDTTPDTTTPDTTTPDTTPDTPDTTTPDTTSPDTTVPPTTTVPDDASEKAEKDNFGRTVSADARGEDGTKGVDGKVISEAARTKPNPGRDRKASTTTTVAPTDPVTTVAPPAGDADDADERDADEGTTTAASAKPEKPKKDKPAKP